MYKHIGKKLKVLAEVWCVLGSLGSIAAGVLLGATAAKDVLGPDVRITRDRGHWTEKKGVWILPTYHPSALLRDESKKPEAWEDMKSLKRKLTELGLYPDIYGTGEPEGSV